jgi:hypothetical protein
MKNYSATMAIRRADEIVAQIDAVLMLLAGAAAYSEAVIRKNAAPIHVPGFTPAPPQCEPASQKKTERHHSDPVFMGGDPKQKKTKMGKDAHRGKGDSLHNDLNDFLRGKTDGAGNHMRPQRGNSGADIRRNFSRQELLRAEAEFYKQFRDRYPDAARDFFKQHPGLE